MVVEVEARNYHHQRLNGEQSKHHRSSSSQRSAVGWCVFESRESRNYWFAAESRVAQTVDVRTHIEE
jgi:hypothetical protein